MYSYLDNNCPGVFSLLYPLDGNIYDDYPLADWEDAIDPDAGDDVTYELWYSQDEDFVNYEAVTDLAESEYQFTSDELDMNATYYWKVAAIDGYSVTWSSETWSFLVRDESELSSVEIDVSSSQSDLLLSWSYTGDAPASVRVLRGADDPVAVSGSLDGATSRWLDRDVTPGESYVYWLEVTGDDGHVRRFGPTEAVVVPEEAQRLSLDEPWPNPASGTVSVAFELPEAQSVSLAVYDLAGRRVATLSEGQLPAGRHAVNWDCAGESSGVYLLRLETSGGLLSKRLVVGR